MYPSLWVQRVLLLPERCVVICWHSHILQPHGYNERAVRGVGTKPLDRRHHVHSGIYHHGVLQRQHVGHPLRVLAGGVLRWDLKVGSDDCVWRRCFGWGGVGWALETPRRGPTTPASPQPPQAAGGRAAGARGAKGGSTPRRWVSRVAGGPGPFSRSNHHP